MTTGLSSLISQRIYGVFSMPLPWRLRTKTLVAGRIPLLMGVVNVTPDSFSDGGRFFEPARRPWSRGPAPGGLNSYKLTERRK